MGSMHAHANLMLATRYPLAHEVGPYLMRYYRGTFWQLKGWCEPVKTGLLVGLGDCYLRVECCIHYGHVMALLYWCGCKFVRLPLDPHKLDSRRAMSSTIFVSNGCPMAW